MNCANHADASAVAYCRTCGKALCANCTRPVRGVIYCEDCLGQRMEGVRTESFPPATGFVAGAVPPPPAPGLVGTAIQSPHASASSGPNPTVAGILAGVFPFGVGAVYTGQYAKGLAHLVIFGLLVAGCNVSNSEALPVICGFGIAFFIVYQIVDAVRTARALQAGLPAPDPYGLGATFGAGSKIEPNKAPIGGIVLILLGVLFLLHTMGLELGLDRFWPLILIGLGGWMFARNWALLGVASGGRCQCARCRAGRLMGPAVLVTIGFLFLFETLGRVSFGRSWPILLLVIGGVKLYQNTASTDGHGGTPPPGSLPPGIPPVPPASPAAPSEVNRG
jgi:Domain of unknown function (DUF5668)/B-box zinc finger